MFVATPHYHHQKETVTENVTAAVIADHGRQKAILITAPSTEVLKEQSALYGETRRSLTPNRDSTFPPSHTVVLNLDK